MSKVFHYLDGFLIVSNPHARDCTVQLSVLRKVFEHLGIPVAMEKLEGPVGLSLLYFYIFQLFFLEILFKSAYYS